MLFISADSTIMPRGRFLTVLSVRLITILFFAFLTNSLLIFYIFFEISLIPIFWIIIGWGGQPERVSAGLNLIIYTACASLPLLLVVILLQIEGIVFFNQLIHTIKAPSMSTREGLTFILLIAFLVKFPIFLVHLWLPKAHVEAPVIGSIILAGLLLKLGGYGVLQFIPILKRTTRLSQLVQALRLFGGIVISVLCLRQKDIKVLIAYSSVRHIAIVISAILLFSEWGMKGRILLIIAHGLISSGIFAAARFPYSRLHTRNIFLLKRNLTIIPVFSLFWFILCLGNMGGPFTLNLIREILIIGALLNYQFLFFCFIFIIVLLAAVYSLILYASTQQGQIRQTNIIPLPLHSKEIRTLTIHIIPAIFLCWITRLIL